MKMRQPDRYTQAGMHLALLGMQELEEFLINAVRDYIGRREEVLEGLRNGQIPVAKRGSPSKQGSLEDPLKRSNYQSGAKTYWNNLSPEERKAESAKRNKKRIATMLRKYGVKHYSKIKQAKAATPKAARKEPKAAAKKRAARRAVGQAVAAELAAQRVNGPAQEA